MAMSEAYKFVKTKRSIISPNLNFMGQLWEFEQGLRPFSSANSNDAIASSSPKTPSSHSSSASMTTSYSISALTDSGIVSDIGSTSCSSSALLPEQLKDIACKDTTYTNEKTCTNDYSMETCTSGAFTNKSKSCLASKIEEACTSRSEEVQRQVAGNNQFLWSEQTISNTSSLSNYNSMSDSSTSNGCGV
jgi:hypothetical protein